MEFQFLLSIAVFAAAMTGTPGPNNMMLTASGANFGYWRTIPHLLGIGMGLVVMILLMAAGMGIIFERFPAFQTAMKWLCSGYLLYLAWKIGTAPPPDPNSSNNNSQNTSRRPMTWLEAALFQFINPKAWAMTVTAIGSFTLSGDNYWLSTITLAVIFWLIGFPCTSVWAGFGSLMGKTMHHPGHWKIFNGLMGLATAACLLFIW